MLRTQDGGSFGRRPTDMTQVEGGTGRENPAGGKIAVQGLEPRISSGFIFEHLRDNGLSPQLAMLQRFALLCDLIEFDEF